MSGRIGKIIEVLNTTLKNGAKVLGLSVDFQGVTHKAVSTGIAGIDAKPLLKDYVVTMKQEHSGNQPIVVGTNDTASISETEKGEIQIYSRNNEGIKQADILIKSDGSVKIENNSGSFELKADGTCSSSGDIVVGGISFLEHMHAYIDSQGAAATPVQSQTEAAN